jgi:hypothetical protein
VVKIKFHKASFKRKLALKWKNPYGPCGLSIESINRSRSASYGDIDNSGRIPGAFPS